MGEMQAAKKRTRARRKGHGDGGGVGEGKKQGLQACKQDQKMSIANDWGLLFLRRSSNTREAGGQREEEERAVDGGRWTVDGGGGSSEAEGAHWVGIREQTIPQVPQGVLIFFLSTLLSTLHLSHSR